MNNKIKKLIILITVLSLSIGSVFWATRELWSNTILDGITVWIDWNTSIANVSGNDGISILSSIFQWFKLRVVFNC